MTQSLKSFRRDRSVSIVEGSYLFRSDYESATLAPNYTITDRYPPPVSWLRRFRHPLRRLRRSSSPATVSLRAPSVWAYIALLLRRYTCTAAPRNRLRKTVSMSAQTKFIIEV